MTTLQAWSLILGVITPLVVSIVNRPSIPKVWRTVIAVGVAVVIGIGNLLVQGVVLDTADLTFAKVVVNLALVIGASQAAYVALWHPSKVAPKIEVATSGRNVVPLRDDLAA